MVANDSRRVEEDISAELYLCSDRLSWPTCFPKHSYKSSVTWILFHEKRLPLGDFHQSILQIEGTKVTSDLLSGSLL